MTVEYQRYYARVAELFGNATCPIVLDHSVIRLADVVGSHNRVPMPAVSLGILNLKLFGLKVLERSRNVWPWKFRV